MRKHFRWLPLLALCLAACDTSDTTPPPPPPGGDEIINGVNLTELFADPTAAEINAVQAEFAQRDAQLSARYTFSFVTESTDPDGATHRVYLAKDALTQADLFYGLIRIPPREPGDQRVRPVLLTLPDGDTDARPGTIADLPIQNPNRSDYVYALVAFRGMTLTVDEASYETQADPSAYDRDADDALAFLAYARALGATVLIDPARAGVIGLGRGGGVALLTASRANSYDVVIDLAGPTDFFLDAFKSRVRSFLNTGTSQSSFPAYSDLVTDILAPLREGTLSIADARLELLRRSPRYFIQPPPFTVAIHGTLDFTVLPNHSRVLEPFIRGETTGLYLELENADHFSLTSDAEVIALVSGQLRTRLGGP